MFGNQTSKNLMSNFDFPFELYKGLLVLSGKLYKCDVTVKDVKMNCSDKQSVNHAVD